MDKTEAFKNWGVLNGHSRETSNLFIEACKLHDEDCEANPEAHKEDGSTPYRCYHAFWCSCGFRYAYDSSD